MVDLDDTTARVAGERMGQPAPVAVLDADQLRLAYDGQPPIERASAHLLILGIGGEGHHMVDFVDHAVGVGSVVHVQPGQVQRFEPVGSYRAQILVVGAGACPSGLFDPSRPLVEAPLGPSGEIVTAVVRDLVAEQLRPDRDEAVMVAGAGYVLHHVARLAADAAPEASAAHTELLRAFRIEVERHFCETRNVSAYARTIGTSTKTLARVTSTLTGLAPKEIIDQRVVLEAKRLLAHNRDSVASIGQGLGFSEATNFTKFFVRLTDRTPHEFRAEPCR